MIVLAVVLVAQAAPSVDPATVAWPSLGVSGAIVVILLWLLRSEREGRDRDRALIVELAQGQARMGAEVVAALDRSTTATRELVAEVRRGLDR